jgi:hypothetical protein
MTSLMHPVEDELTNTYVYELQMIPKSNRKEISLVLWKIAEGFVIFLGEMQTYGQSFEMLESSDIVIDHPRMKITRLNLCE